MSECMPRILTLQGVLAGLQQLPGPALRLSPDHHRRHSRCAARCGGAPQWGTLCCSSPDSSQPDPTLGAEASACHAGACPAGGCCLAMCCDYRVMTEAGSIGEPRCLPTHENRRDLSKQLRTCVAHQRDACLWSPVALLRQGTCRRCPCAACRPERGGARHLGAKDVGRCG